MKISSSIRTFIVVCVCALTSCRPNPSEQAASANASREDSTKLAILREAYLYGYPLMVMHASMRAMTNVSKPVNEGRLLAPVNHLVSATTFPDDKFRDVVRANCDTYYTMGWLNLSDNPMLLKLPDTKGRYYLFPMLDAWTNVFVSPGKRTTGTGAQQYLLTPPGWQGDVPTGVELIKAPTNLVWIIGRVQVNSARDGNTVVKGIQDGISLTPLKGNAGSTVALPDTTMKEKAPNDVVIEMPTAAYFALLNKLMLENPPPEADSAILNRMAPLGIGPGATFDGAGISVAYADSLATLPAWAKKTMMRSGLSGTKLINGWGVNRGLGSYGTRYAFRAGVAYGGLGANLDEDAMYPGSLTDADGEPYDGSRHRYILHFAADELPPAKAFWSLTMYDDEGFMCANPINRFAIGDRDNLKKNKDGSVDILIQHEKPALTTNWLPAPSSTFNLLLRVYWPDERATKGQWSPPGVKKNE